MVADLNDIVVNAEVSSMDIGSVQQGQPADYDDVRVGRLRDSLTGGGAVGSAGADTELR